MRVSAKAKRASHWAFALDPTGNESHSGVCETVAVASTIWSCAELNGTAQHSTAHASMEKQF